MERSVRNTQSKLAATALVIGCILYIACSMMNQTSFDYDETMIYHSNRFLLAAPESEPDLAVNEQVYKLKGNFSRRKLERRLVDVLSSRRLKLNLNQYHWKTCPAGEDMFLGDLGIIFREEPNPQDSTTVPQQKHLRFHLERKDDRSCLWNYSKACLAGGNFIMNFGKPTPRMTDMRKPGDYKLKTKEGPIRIVAYNTNAACSRKWQEDSTVRQEYFSMSPANNGTSASPLDYLRQSKSSALDPDACTRFIQERESKNDLFSFNSDITTVHIDTPWMQISIQVRQNKIATESICNFAKMNVWINSVDPNIDLEVEKGPPVSRYNVHSAYTVLSSYNDDKI